MIDGKAFYDLFSSEFGFDISNSDLVYKSFLAELRKKLQVGKTISIEGIGFFKREDENTLVFVNENELDDKLFEKIELPAEDENEFELNENVFAIGGDSPVIPVENVSDPDKVEVLQKVLENISEKINDYKIIDDFDPLTYADSRGKKEDESEPWHNELKEELLSDDIFDEDIDDESVDSTENIEDIVKEEPDLIEELNAEIIAEDEPEEKVEKEEETIPEESEEELTEPEEEDENGTLENDVIAQEDLDRVFGDDDSEEEIKEESKEKEKETKKKKFKLFGKKKEKKPKKEKKKKDKKSKKKKKDEPEKEGEEGNEEKKKSKKLLIILIAVFLLITLGGVYFFFFTGGEEPAAEHEKTAKVDSVKEKRTPITPEELGMKEKREMEIPVDIHNPEKTKGEDSYNVIDPRLMKTFPHEKRITNKIYFSDGKYMVQLSSWRDSERASQIVEKLYSNGFNAFVVKAYLPQLGGTWYRVRIGFFDTLKEAKDFIKKREFLYVR